MPRYACGCWLEIYRPSKGARCRARWPSLCSLHDDGPDELMLAAAKTLAERGQVSPPPPPPLRPCERCGEPVAPSPTHPRQFCARCERHVRRERAVRAQRNRRVKLRPTRPPKPPKPPKPPRPAPAPLPERPCSECEHPFTPTRRWQAVCSPACSTARARRREAEKRLDPDWLEAERARAREAYQRKKAVAAGAKL